MIEMKRQRLHFSFPEIHQEARVTVEFQRTLRIPDDDKTYPLPPGLGTFPLEHVDDYAAKVPATWLQRGGVMLPMYQSEAMWLRFDSATILDRMVSYPFAIKIATGKQCAVSGKAWTDGLRRSPQNYMVSPIQPWLDGYVVEEGLIRQFVAMPLGAGYTAEEQLTGEATYGGLQIAVYPMKREVFERRFPERKAEHRSDRVLELCCERPVRSLNVGEMGLAPGGRMKQEIFEDPYNLSDWELSATSRCFVHICNSLVWQSITNKLPPHPAPTAKQYTKAKLPWFEYYDEQHKAVAGAPSLQGLQSVHEISAAKGDVALPENESVTPENLIVYRKGLKVDQVRECVL